MEKPKIAEMKQRAGVRTVEFPLWFVVSVLVLLVLLALLFWSAKARDPAHVRPEPIATFEETLPSIAGLTQTTVIEDNAVEVIQDAAFFDRLIADVGRAEKTVNFETYVWWRGEVCRRIADAFSDAARRGVQVRVLLDAYGSWKMDEELAQQMRDSGVRLVKYHPFDLHELAEFNNRDHRKVAVIDGRIGYAFGHGIAAEWTDEAEHPPWEDTAIRVRGPLVHQLQLTFMQNWMEAAEEVPVGEEFFPDPQPAGSIRGHVTLSSAHGTISSVELLYKLAIASAQETIFIQNPYFAPNPDLIDLLVDAAGRGVRVRLMVPGEGSDSAMALHASHHYYERLLQGGVAVFEYDRTLLHKKIMVVDGIWSHVGSTNLDARSLEINDEVSVGLIDAGIADLLTREFEHDLQHCTPITLDSWRQHRGLPHILLDRLMYLTHEQI